MRVTFLGNAPWSVPSLEALAGSTHDLALVVTREPRPAGRGGDLRPTAVAEAARRVGLPVREVATVKEGPGLEALRDSAPEVLAVVAYGEIVPRPVLDLPSVAPVNVHFSLLPRWRGAAPVQRAILDSFKSVNDELASFHRVRYEKDGQVIEQGTIVIRGGRIVSASAGSTAAPGVRALDGKGLTAVAGYIDAHRHIVPGGRGAGGGVGKGGDVSVAVVGDEMVSRAADVIGDFQEAADTACALHCAAEVCAPDVSAQLGVAGVRVEFADEVPSIVEEDDVCLFVPAAAVVVKLLTNTTAMVVVFEG